MTVFYSCHSPPPVSAVTLFCIIISLYIFIFIIYIHFYIYTTPATVSSLLHRRSYCRRSSPSETETVICHLSSSCANSVTPLPVPPAHSAPRLAVPTPQRGVSVPPCGACFFPCGGENFSCGGSFSLLCSSKTLKASPLRIRTCSPGLSKPGYERSEHPRTYEFDKHIRCHQP